MTAKLRNMTSLYIFKGDKALLLYRQGSRVVNDMWIGSAGGHFEPEELNDAKACVLRELNEELELAEKDLSHLELRYVTLRRCNGEIRQNYYFFADLKDEVDVNFHSSEGISRWFDLSELNSLEMPFTSNPPSLPCLTPLSGTAQKRKTSHPLPRTGICRHADSQYFSRSGFQAQALYVWWKQDSHLGYVQAFR